MPQAGAPPAATTSPPGVTPKGIATRARILQTAAEAFAESGYADTTLAELIARSGMTKGAFYFYFPSKEQLALAVLEEKQRQWLEAVEQRVLAEPTAIGQLRALGPAIVELHRADESAFSIYRLTRDLNRMPEISDRVRERMNAWLQLVAGILERAQAEGEVPSWLDATALATILIAATDGLKDLSELLEPPGQSREGYERRMRELIALVEAALESKQAARR
jgi:AcrR family transcriptional regulator